MDILEFQGEYRWLSNFWPCSVLLDGMKFNSVEAAYVAAKTTDIAVRKQVQELTKPGDCKRFGRSIKLRTDWESIKLQIMEDLLRQKFAKGSPLAKKLVATGTSRIEEGNKWGDTFWGVCRGKGNNHLGKLLMKIRTELLSNGEENVI